MINTNAATHDIYILTGPTGSGKTQLGLELAERLGAEIVSMDSMALYRGMDIGTAKPLIADRQRVPHHLIDVLDPWESASVAWWHARALACAAEIRARGKRVLFVGGTPLYLKALLRGIFSGPAADHELRRRLSAEAQAIGTPALHARLAQIDPVTAERVHPNDLLRIVRALEVWELSGQPISAWQQQWRPGIESALETVRRQPGNAVWLDLPRQELYARIDTRVEGMFRTGLVDEVMRLRSLDKPLSREALQALGYKEALAHLDGAMTLPETIQLVQQRSRNFAKRQISWFRHLPELRPVRIELTPTLWQSTIHEEKP